MKKFLLILIIAGSALALSLSVAGLYFYNSYKNTPMSDVPNEVIYEISTGKSFNAVASDLAAAGIIKNPQIFSLYARTTQQRDKLKRGEYLLRTNMTPQEVLDVITSGKSIEKSLTVSEGLNIFEIATIFAKHGLVKKPEEFMQLVRDKQFIKELLGEEQVSLEGYLFPETYKYNKFSTARSVVASMVRRFLAVYNEFEKLPRPHNWTRHQVVTFASIVEKETGAAFERPLISSVFHNRINKGMRLQTDPTIIYGKADITGKFEIRIDRSDILAPTRYNTYVIAGLPPGPIANPGKEAIAAALKPATSNYYFFVSQNDGTHIFSETYEQHNKAVQKFQKDPKAREGKSWRDLNKKSGS
ncbi:MAG: endolytic transglycosylase MltG [Bdellovibrionia bacterium]